MTSPTVSPKPTKKQKGMDFYEALKSVMNGEFITREEWNDRDTYLCLSEGRLRIYKSDTQKLYDLIVQDGDILGTDWLIVAKVVEQA